MPHDTVSLASLPVEPHRFDRVKIVGSANFFGEIKEGDFCDTLAMFDEEPFGISFLDVAVEILSAICRREMGEVRTRVGLFRVSSISSDADSEAEQDQGNGRKGFHALNRDEEPRNRCNFS